MGRCFWLGRFYLLRPCCVPAIYPCKSTALISGKRSLVLLCFLLLQLGFGSGSAGPSSSYGGSYSQVRDQVCRGLLCTANRLPSDQLGLLGCS